MEVSLKVKNCSFNPFLERSMVCVLDIYVETAHLMCVATTCYHSEVDWLPILRVPEHVNY